MRGTSLTRTANVEISISCFHTSSLRLTSCSHQCCSVGSHGSSISSGLSRARRGLHLSSGRCLHPSHQGASPISFRLAHHPSLLDRYPSPKKPSDSNRPFSVRDHLKKTFRDLSSTNCSSMKQLWSYFVLILALKGSQQSGC